MDLGLTRAQLAERLGCLLASVSQWERGRSEPHVTRWPAIEAALGSGLVPERNGLPGRIRAARLRLGLTQEELARRAGVHVRTVRNAERGIHRAGRRTLRRLFSTIGVE
jgi:transcriptional regulator with XRE-family HTH domain